VNVTSLLLIRRIN